MLYQEYAAIVRSGSDSTHAGAPSLIPYRWLQGRWWEQQKDGMYEGCRGGLPSASPRHGRAVQLGARRRASRRRRARARYRDGRGAEWKRGQEYSRGSARFAQSNCLITLDKSRIHDRTCRRREEKIERRSCGEISGTVGDINLRSTLPPSDETRNMRNERKAPGPVTEE